MLEGGLAVRLESDAGVELLTIGVGWSDPGAGLVWQEVPLGDDGLAVVRWSGTFARVRAPRQVAAPNQATSPADHRAHRALTGRRRPQALLGCQASTERDDR